MAPLILSLLIALNISHLIYFNVFTHSLPYGIYMKVEGAPQRGGYAASCLTSEIAAYGMERGYLAPGGCATGTVLVLKMIKGLPGDHFSAANHFLKINNRSYPIMEHDSIHRPLKVFYAPKSGILKEGQYLLLSDFVPDSWDSRYWGPVGIQFLLKPLWTWG